MANWEKLNKEFDDALDSMTSEDWGLLASKRIKQTTRTMNKMTKLAIALAISIIGSLLIPIFTQWYEQQTGITPIGFYFVYVLGSLFSIFAIATNNFKDF